MKIFSFIIAFLLAFTSQAWAGDDKYPLLTVNLVPLRNSYHVGEPITYIVELKSKNSVKFSGGSQLPITFVVEEKNFKRVSPSLPHIPIKDMGIAMSTILTEDVVYREILVVNRYMAFDKPGKYIIPFHIELYGLGGIQQVYSSKSQELVVTIDSGPIDSIWINDVIEKFKRSTGKGVKKIGEEIEENKQGNYELESLTKRQLGEILLWTDSSEINDILVESMPEVQEIAFNIISRVRDKISTNAKLQEKFLASVAKSQFYVVVMALEVLRQDKIELPEPWVANIFSSSRRPAIDALVDYFATWGKTKDIHLLELLAKSNNKDLAEQADGAIKEIRSRDVKNTPGRKLE